VNCVQLSEGIRVVHKLSRMDSYDDKHDLMHLSPIASNTGQVNFPLDVLQGYVRVPETDEAEEPHPTAPRRKHRHHDGELDRGPYEAWCRTEAYRRGPESVMSSGEEWLRERAYVMWDSARMEKQAGGFGEKPESESSYEDTAKAEEEVLHSLVERSEIWRKGGSGYWSKGDTSRIEWKHRWKKPPWEEHEW